jgi:hypothetical protein
LEKDYAGTRTMIWENGEDQDATSAATAVSTATCGWLAGQYCLAAAPGATPRKRGQSAD